MSETIYEDGFCTVTFAEKPCAVGHLTVLPKEAVFLEDLSHEQSDHLFTVASYCATLLFEGLKAQGTNIIAANGPGAYMANESEDRVIVHIIPRTAEDGLGLLWQPKQGDPTAIKDAADKISSKMRFGDEPKQEKVVMQHPLEQSSEEADESKDDYRVKDLRRMP